MCSSHFTLNVSAGLTAAIGLWLIVLEARNSSPFLPPCSFFQCFQNCTFTSPSFESAFSRMIQSLSISNDEIMLLQFSKSIRWCYLRGSCRSTIYFLENYGSSSINLPCKLACGACRGKPSALSFECDAGNDALFWRGHKKEKDDNYFEMVIPLNKTHFAFERACSKQL